MKNLSISLKLLWLLLLPMLGIVFYTGMVVKNAVEEWRGLSTTSTLIEVSVGLGELTHRLQIERGSTFGFIQSGGVKFSKELPEYRAATDKALADVNAKYAASRTSGLPLSVTSKLDEALAQLKMLEETRKAASQQSIAAKEMAARYTKSIATIQSTIPTIAEQSTDLYIVKLMTAYNAFLNLKERSGQERALLTGVFTADKFESLQYQAFISHLSAQNAYQQVFSDYAPENITAEYSKAIQSQAFNDVAAMRKIAMEKGIADEAMGIDSTVWFKSMTARIDTLHTIENQLAEQIKTFAAEHAQGALVKLIVMASISALILGGSIVLMIWVSQSIVGPINNLKQTITKIQREHDLTSRLVISGHDEIGQASESFNLLVSSLQASLKQVNDSASRVLQFSETIAASSTQLAVSVSTQSEAASSMAAAVEEMTTSVDQIADNAAQVRDISRASSAHADQGCSIILKATADMRGIADAVNDSSLIMSELGQHSDQIISIVQVIKEIAEQTNLLALNAAIEAARAGEQGRGFAVVADEVRKLAERTSQSTGEITSMIERVQSGTKQAIASMAIGVERVNEEAAMTETASSSITLIQSGTQQVGAAISGISDAIREQSAVSGEIARQVEKVAQMSEENSAATHTNTETAHQMEALAISLQGLVAKFRV